MTDVAPTELEKLLRNMFYKHYAPLALVDQRVCQQYRLAPHSKGCRHFNSAKQLVWQLPRPNLTPLAFSLLSALRKYLRYVL